MVMTQEERELAIGRFVTQWPALPWLITTAKGEPAVQFTPSGYDQIVNLMRGNNWNPANRIAVHGDWCAGSSLTSMLAVPNGLVCLMYFPDLRKWRIVGGRVIIQQGRTLSMTYGLFFDVEPQDYMPIPR